MYVCLLPPAGQTSPQDSRSHRNVSAAFSSLYVFINFPYYLFRSAPIGFLSSYCGTFGKFSRWHRHCRRSPVRASISYSCLRQFTLFLPREIKYRRRFSSPSLPSSAVSLSERIWDLFPRSRVRSELICRLRVRFVRRSWRCHKRGMVFTRRATCPGENCSWAARSSRRPVKRQPCSPVSLW